MNTHTCVRDILRGIAFNSGAGESESVLAYGKIVTNCLTS